jgi:hypothetical protein
MKRDLELEATIVFRIYLPYDVKLTGRGALCVLTATLALHPAEDAAEN